MRYLSADVGGTFTDLVLIDSEGGALHLDKVPSTPESANAVTDGIRRITGHPVVGLRKSAHGLHSFDRREGRRNVVWCAIDYELEPRAGPDTFRQLFYSAVPHNSALVDQDDPVA